MLRHTAFPNDSLKRVDEWLHQVIRMNWSGTHWWLCQSLSSYLWVGISYGSTCRAFCLVPGNFHNSTAPVPCPCKNVSNCWHCVVFPARSQPSTTIKAPRCLALVDVPVCVIRNRGFAQLYAVIVVWCGRWLALPRVKRNIENNGIANREKVVGILYCEGRH